MNFSSRLICLPAIMGLSFLLPGMAGAVTVRVPVVEDTFLIEDNGANAGGHSHVSLGTSNGGSSRRGLFRFDVAAVIPAGATINSVTFSTNVTLRGGGNNFTANLSALTSDWGEGVGTGNNGRAAIAGEANWTENFSTSSTWATAGGDFSGTLSSVLIDAVGMFTFASGGALVSSVQQMLDDAAGDFGFILSASDESLNGTAVRLGSLEDGSPAFLSVDFTPVPEPSALSLLVLAAGFLSRRRR